MVCVLESFWTWRVKVNSIFLQFMEGFKTILAALSGIPNCGHCADANARKASATKCGWEWIMDFHPDVSIMSAAWLKNKSKRCLLRSTLQNALLHCHFFLIYRFQNSVSYVFTPLELTNISSSPYWCFLLWLELSIYLQVQRSWSVWLWSAELDSHCPHLYTHSSKSSFL